MSGRTGNVLFLCTGNSARSVLAESVLNQLGKGRFRAYSAGSMPAGKVNPFTLELLKARELPVDGLRSKSWEEFARPGAPQMDYIITVCDNAAGEVCPVWPGHPATAHWGFEDPAAFTGPDAEKRRVFERIFEEIGVRVRQFLALPFDKVNRPALLAELRALGKGAPP
jgi:arsenate reductase